MHSRREFLLAAGGAAGLCAAAPGLVFACRADNDLYAALGGRHRRHATALEAVDAAPQGAGVLLLADDYPAAPLPLTAALFEAARRKRLRVYVEYPSYLPGVTVAKPRHTEYERAVVASTAFGDELAPMRILGIQDCHFVPVPAPRPDIVVARVAGVDTAVYGLPASGVHPILFEMVQAGLLVSTTKLSQFVTARYAPLDAWNVVWRRILAWLGGGAAPATMNWTPTVAPSYGANDDLPAAAERDAFTRGAAWFEKGRVLVHPTWKRFEEQSLLHKDRIGPSAAGLPHGDGTLGMIEGYNSTIRHDGSQPQRWYWRADCNAESAFALALSGRGHAAHRAVATNLNDFVWTRSILTGGSRGDELSPAFGLLDWDTRNTGVYYGDDNARAMLGTIGSAAALGSARWDEGLLRAILANFRTTGPGGFRRSRIDEKDLLAHGWRHYYRTDLVNFSPHYEAYLWAVCLWTYHKTGYRPLLDRIRPAIARTMAAYPNEWRWTNGIQQERARMLLPLAWLVRVDDTAEHRRWLGSMAAELIRGQEACGAIREELGPAGKGAYWAPRSNAEYGTREAPLLQRNGDPLCDLLYTSNFAFLGLHEAAAAGDPDCRAAADSLARFLCRIQVRSRRHDEFDGAWFRAFNYRSWEYWASNADAGWGTWSIETGWTQAWITAVFGMRLAGTSLWDLSAGSRIANAWPRWQKVFLPEG